MGSDRTRTALMALGALALVLGCAKDDDDDAPANTPDLGAATELPSLSVEPGDRGRAEAMEGQTVEVTLCDGETTTVVPKGTAGTTIAGALMNEWLQTHPGERWESQERERHTLEPAADNTDLIGRRQGATYGRITKQDVALWRAETERVALAGSEVFHSAEKLGSTIGVSCDMCHPDAANTHPETYPKFQTQLGRVALLRDMINWCIEHPVRGTPLASDSPQMRALEAYILAQRRGEELIYGKH